MFQTELHLWLQSFDYSWLRYLMLFISNLGDRPFYTVLLAIVMFGVSYRKGFILLQAMIWGGIFNDVLKAAFGLPRPSEVDSRVLHPEYSGNGPEQTQFTAMGARDFWSLPPPAVIQHYRALNSSFGLPSGHVILSCTIWLSLALLFRRRLTLVLAALVIPLTMLSRMYLGRHFLADVLAGLAVGVSLVVLVHVALVQFCALTQAVAIRVTAEPRLIVLLVALLVLPVLAAFLPHAEIEDVGRLLGFNVGFLLVMRKGFHGDSAGLLRRGARVLLAVFLFVVSATITEAALAGIFGEPIWVSLLNAFVPAFVMSWATVAVGQRLDLYPREVARPSIDRLVA